MQNLDRTGTYLKYFGRKQDTVYIKNLLISIKLRWKKLVRRTDEKGRLLQQAYKEDKRVSTLTRSLPAWRHHMRDASYCLERLFQELFPFMRYIVNLEFNGCHA